MKTGIVLVAPLLLLVAGCSKKSLPENAGPVNNEQGQAIPAAATEKSKASATTRAGAATVASITLGAEPKSAGLTLVNLNGDGACEVTEAGGVSCHGIRREQGQSPTYLYFQLAAGTRLRPSEVLVMVEYYDASSGEITLDYDSNDELSRNPGYTRVPTRVALNKDQRWHNGAFVLRQPRFQHGQHDGGDFRIGCNGRELFVRSVQVLQEQ